MSDETNIPGESPDLSELTAADVQFCLRLSQGESQHAAFVAVYGARDTDIATRAAASRLAKNRHIADYLAYLTQQASEAARITIEELAAWNRQAMKANLQRCIDPDDPYQFLPLDQWPPEIVELIDKIEFETFKDGKDGPVLHRIKKVSLTPKGQANRRLMEFKKMIGTDSTPAAKPQQPILVQGADLDQL